MIEDIKRAVVEGLIVAAARDLVTEYGAFVHATESIDAGEFAPAVEPPEWLDAAIDVAIFDGVAS